MRATRNPAVGAIQPSYISQASALLAAERAGRNIGTGALVESATRVGQIVRIVADLAMMPTCTIRAC